LKYEILDASLFSVWTYATTESDLLIHILYRKVYWQDLPCIEFQSVMQNVRNYSTGQTFGWPVLPLVYITTAIPFFVGKLGGT
jgi:hypothetical protein